MLSPEERNEFCSGTDDAMWMVRKVFWRVLWFVLVVSIVCGTIGFVWHVLSQPAAVIEKTLDADNIIYNYEWFKATYEKVDATDKQIENCQQQLDGLKKDLGPSRKDWSYTDKNEYDRVNTELTGLKQFRAGLVADYNARSKMVNRSIFKQGLPVTIQ